MKTIDREELKSMMDSSSVAVVEVLDEGSFRSFHLPNAINVPLSDDFDTQIQAAIPNKAQPVVVYCRDMDCDASPMAARRMEELGYETVLDYAAGKQDWRDAKLPVVG